MSRYILCLLSIIFLSCSDSILESTPQFNSELNYFETETDVERSIISTYAKLTDIYWFNANNPKHYLWLLPGDDVSSTGLHTYENFVGIQSGNRRVAGYYDPYYEIIRLAYTALELTDRYAQLYETPGLREWNRGEALFLMGYANFKLWTAFGPYAPLVTQRINSVDQVLSASPGDHRMLDSAIAQLQRASLLLPEGWTDNQRGRVTRNSAFGMMGKALVFRANYRGNDQDWLKAIAAFEELNGVSLVPNFADNFSAFTENNMESLFEFQASSAPGFDGLWLSNGFNQAVGAMHSYWGMFSGVPAWMEGVPFRPTQKLIDAMIPFDGRIPATIDTSNSTFFKYVINDSPNTSGIGSSRNNPRILRYADVLLLWAEALLETGQPVPAIEKINQVRTRARNFGDTGFPENYDTSETNAELIHTWIRNERFIELAAEEGHRWDDLRRWHAYGKIQLHNWTAEYTGAVNSFSIRTHPEIWEFDALKHLWWPIPEQEIRLNSQARQNPAYL